LKFALQVVTQSRRFKFRNVVTALFFLGCRLQRLSVGVPVGGNRGWKLHATLLFALANDLGSRGAGGRVSLGDCDADGDTLRTTTLLLS